MNTISNNYRADSFDNFYVGATTVGFEQCPATQYFLSCIVNRSGTFCPTPDAMLQEFDKRAAKTLVEIWHSFLTILPVLYFLAIGYVVARKLYADADNLNRFLIEFIIVALPILLCVNVFNYAVEYVVLVLTIGMALLIYSADCFSCILKNADLIYNLGGSRPHMLTLARATINLLTVISILAVDFESFPKEFRKTRRFGAALMDTGIGLFVFAMGSVSRRLANSAGCLHLLRHVVPILFLGVARTIVITAIGYHQDEHEYGTHLNAFFTLGLTKLCGTLLSTLTTNVLQSSILGLVILIFHEIALSFGMSDFVMSMTLKRDTFLIANREGICSLPGFIALYLIAMSMGQWLKCSEQHTGRQILKKLGQLLLYCAGLWLSVVLSLPIVGIARVTCNLGYVAWTLAIALTMSTLYMFVFDIVLQTITKDSWKSVDNRHDEELEITLKTEKITTNTKTNQKQYNNETNVPILVESINYNGLVYFLLANILTGQVNIFLKPEKRSNFESILILLIYMFISTFVVFILYIKRIKIA